MHRRSFPVVWFINTSHLNLGYPYSLHLSSNVLQAIQV
jgi:hypothetical protein